MRDEPRATEPRTVLLVDDEAEARRLTYHALKRECRVLEAGDADSALALLERERVDLVLLDLHLPPRLESPREGLRIQQRIRQLERRVPVVVLSADPDPAVRAAVLRGGAREFLAKPVDVDRLMRVVKALLAEAVV